MVDLNEIMTQTAGLLECPSCHESGICEASTLRFALDNKVVFRCLKCLHEWTLPVSEVTSEGDPVSPRVQAILAHLARMKPRF